MNIIFTFPFVDVRELKGLKLLKLDTCRNYGSHAASNKIFIRSFGMIKERKCADAGGEQFYCESNKAVHFCPNNIFFSNKKKFIPKVIFRRCYNDNINCRLDIGIKNTIKNKYNVKDFDTIIEKLSNTNVVVPALKNQNIRIPTQNLKNLSNKLIDLYLYSTTPIKKYEYRKDYIINANPIVLVVIKEEEIVDISSISKCGYKKIRYNTIEDNKIRIFIKKSSKVYRNAQVNIFLMITNAKTTKEKIENLTIFLRRNHEEKECFLQVDRVFDKPKKEILDTNEALREYYERYIYDNLFKKRKYGIESKYYNVRLEEIDRKLDEKRIKYLKEYFSLRKYRKIKGELNQVKEKNNHRTTINVKENFGIISSGDNNINNMFSNSLNKYEKDIEDLKNEIDQLEDITNDMKCFTKEILEEILNAIVLGDKLSQKNIESKFKGFLKGVGKASISILNAFSSYASIVSLLNL